MSNDYIRVTDLFLPDLSIYASCSEAQLAHYYEPETGLFIAESVPVVERALDAGYRPHSILINEEVLPKPRVLELLERIRGTRVYTAPRPVLDELTGFYLTGGVLCAMYREEIQAPEALFARAGRLAVLEGVTNPTNVGAIFRSAAALGMEGVLLGPGCADPLYRRCIRVSMGTVFQIPWARTQTEDLAGDLNRAGYHTVAMALEEKSVSLRDFTLKPEEKAAVLLGNEGYGLKPETIQGCDTVVMIPMENNVDSLNVAAASAVVFWAAGRVGSGHPAVKMGSGPPNIL